MKGTPIRIKLNYKNINASDLVEWLAANDIKHSFIPYNEDDDPNMRIDTLIYYLEVYNAKHETALRIKWDVVG